VLLNIVNVISSSLSVSSDRFLVPGPCSRQLAESRVYSTHIKEVSNFMAEISTKPGERHVHIRSFMGLTTFT
jgi:hypothetical protein